MELKFRKMSSLWLTSLDDDHLDNMWIKTALAFAVSSTARALKCWTMLKFQSKPAFEYACHAMSNTKRSKNEFLGIQPINQNTSIYARAHTHTHTHMSMSCKHTHTHEHTMHTDTQTHTHNSILEIPPFSLFRYLSSNKQAKGSNPGQPGHAQHTQASPLMVCQLPSHRLFLAGSLNVVEMAPAPLSVINTTCTGHKTWSSTVAMNLTTFFCHRLITWESK